MNYLRFNLSILTKTITICHDREEDNKKKSNDQATKQEKWIIIPQHKNLHISHWHSNDDNYLMSQKSLMGSSDQCWSVLVTGKYQARSLPPHAGRGWWTPGHNLMQSLWWARVSLYLSLIRHEKIFLIFFLKIFKLQYKSWYIIYHLLSISS